MKRQQTEEEKIANAIGRQIGNLNIDLERIGQHIARVLPTVIYNRFIVVAETAVAEKEAERERETSRGHYTLFN